jgi:hypothetical protein
MGGGSIIINRLAVLKPAATDPSIYDSLPTNAKLTVDTICAKAPGSVTESDIQTLAAKILLATHC